MKTATLIKLAVLLAVEVLLLQINFGRVHAQSDRPEAEVIPADQIINILGGDSGANRLSAQQNAEVGGTTEEWKFTNLGGYPGHYAVAVKDIDHDGQEEIIITSVENENIFWQVLRATSPNNYEIVWTSRNYYMSIFTIEAEDINNDGIIEIIVVFSNGYLNIYRGTDFQELKIVGLGRPVDSFTLGDANGDGKMEFLVSAYEYYDNLIAAYDAATNQLIWQISDYGGKLAIGNVDDDNQPEIVSSAGYVIDGLTHIVEWYYPGPIEGFMQPLALVDVDGDGKKEIASAADNNGISIFNVDLKEIAWIIPTLEYPTVLLFEDINNDGSPETIYASQNISIQILDTHSGELIREIVSSNSDKRILTIGDPDSDGSKELIWGSGYFLNIVDNLYIADINSGTVEWRSQNLDGPFTAIDFGDVDDDGEIEILMASFSSLSGYDNGLIYCFNGSTHEVEWTINDIPGINTFRGIRSILINDLDQDGETEFAIAATKSNKGLLQIYNGKTHALEKEISGETFTHFTTIKFGDIDADGKSEILVGGEVTTSPSEGVRLYIFDGTTSEMKWASPYLGDEFMSIQDILLADVNGDGYVEILCLVEDTGVFIFDGFELVQEGFIPISGLALEVGGLYPDNSRPIMVGHAAWGIDFFNGKTFEYEGTLPPFIGPVTCLKKADVDGNFIDELLVCADNRLEIYSMGTGELLWQSRELMTGLGRYNQLRVGQVDGDEAMEILFGGQLALFQFNTPWVGLLDSAFMLASSDQLQTGDIVTYSVVIPNPQIVPAEAVELINTLPNELVFIPESLSYTMGSGSYSVGEIRWSGSIPPETFVVISYQALVKSNTLPMYLINSALLQFQGKSKPIIVGTWIDPSSVFLPVIQKTSPSAVCGSFSDDFQNWLSGWPVTENSAFSTSYFAGEFRFLLKNNPSGYLIKAPTCKRQNYTVEVDVSWDWFMEGEYTGIIFGLTEDFSRYYSFGIDPKYKMFTLTYWSETSGTEWIAGGFTESIYTRDWFTNHLKVTRNGSAITLAINGTVIGTFTHSGSTGETHTGIYHMIWDYPMFEARFDNYSVKALPGSTGISVLEPAPLESNTNRLNLNPWLDLFSKIEVDPRDR